MRFRIKKMSSDKIVPVIVAVQAITFNMNTLLYSTALNSIQYTFFSLIIYAVLVYVGIICCGIKRLPIKGIQFFFICTILISITVLMNCDFNILYVAFLMELAKAVIVTWFMSFRDYVRIYVKTITILAAISLVIHFSIMFIPELLRFGKVVYNQVGTKFYSYVLFFESTNEKFRNYGFLSEPGDYQHYTNIALLLCLFSNEFSDREKRKNSVILTLTSISTFSPAGFVFLGCVWMAYCFRQSSFNKNFCVNRKTLLLIFAAIVALVGVSQTLFFKERVMYYTIGKLNGTVSNSMSVRVQSIFAGFKCFLDNPLFGSGYTKATNNMVSILTEYGYHPTSTVSSLLAMFGLPFTLLFVIPFIGCFFMNNIKNKLNPISSAFIVLGLLMSINNERYMWELTYNIFVVYYVIERRRYHLKTKNLEDDSYDLCLTRGIDYE